jgi:hypothetical protein
MAKEKIPSRPLFTGEWNQDHVGWFMWRFQDDAKEIDARKVQQAFGERKGDDFPELWESKEEVFRYLMRLIVKYKLARVTQGFSESKDYRIKVVSSNYPYIEKVFDDEIFSHPLIANPLSGILDLKMLGDAMLKGSCKTSLYIKIVRYEMASRLSRNSFCYYQDGGADMESEFEQFDEFRELHIEYYVLLSFELIYMYKLIKVLCTKMSEYKLYDYNEIFAFAFYCKCASGLLQIAGKNSNHSKSYTNRNIHEMLTAITTNSDPSNKRVNVSKALEKAHGLVDKELSPTDFVHGFASGAWLYEISENSGDSDVEKARVDWIARFEALMKYGLSL